MMALCDLLRADADVATIICRDGGAYFTLADLRARTEAIARTIVAAGARRVAVCVDDPYDFACAFFAAMATANETVIPASAAPGYLHELAHAYDLLLDAAALAECAREYVGGIEAAGRATKPWQRRAQ